MKKRFKKILSIMLASAMLVTNVPTGTFAEDSVSAASVDDGEIDTSKVESPEDNTEKEEVKEETESVKSEESAPVERAASKAEEVSETELESVSDAEGTPISSVVETEKKEETEKKNIAPQKSDTSKITKVTTKAAAADNNDDDNDNNDDSGKEKIDITWEKQEKYEWTGEVQEQIPTASAKNSAGEAITLIPKLTGKTTNGQTVEQAVERGEYTVTVSLSAEDAEKYTLSNPSQTFKIEPREVAVEWPEEKTSEYTGTEQELPIAYYENVNKKKIECGVLEKDNKTFQNADTYTFIASTPDENYELKNPEFDFEITKKELDVIWLDTKGNMVEEGHAFTYDGTKQQPIAQDIEVSEGNSPVTIKLVTQVTPDEEPINCGPYSATASIADSQYEKNYELKEAAVVRNFSIATNKVEVVWKEDSIPKKYDGEVHSPAAYYINLEGELVECIVTEDAGKEIKNVDKYSVTASLKQDDPDSKNYKLTGETNRTFEIERLNITIKPKSGQGKDYGEIDPLPYKYEISYIEDDPDLKMNDQIRDELEKEIGENILQRKEGSNVEKYKYSLSKTPSNYAVTVEEEYFEITPKEVEVEWDENSIPKEYDGEAHSPVAYYINLEGEPVECIVTEDAGKEIKNVDKYSVTVSLKQDDPDSKNYKLTGETNRTFEIERLNITITPKSGQGKVYGEIDPLPYEYEISYIEDDPDLKMNDQIRDELENEIGENILQREEGNDIGEYKYSLSGTPSNYAVTVEEEYYEIEAISIEAEENKITSRKGSFSLTATNLDEDLLDNKTERKIVITAEFPEDNKGIVFSEDLDDYISGAEKGIDFTGKVEKTIHIGDFEYKTTKGKQELKWNGKLPAGTVLKLWVCDAKGERVSNIETIKVIQYPVSLEWGSTADENPATTYLSKNDKLTLSGNKGEYVEVKYNGTTYYSSLDQTITPVVNNSGSKHDQQTATAGFVDVLNLTFEEASYKFTYDNEAFQIPSDSIRFENRGKTVSITLPEIGTIKEVTIPGGKVTVSGETGTTFDFPVSWSGKDLIPTGSAISVSYMDQGGNEGKGSSVASRSTVTTPITLKIRPELNGNGYLNGRSNTLIVSGSACACEPIRVTVADMSQSTYASQKEVWSDSNGTWEAMFDMSRLPEGGDFQITAEYMDVNGPSAAMTARFDAYVASPATLSPIYEEMTHLSGMAEPGTAVVLIVGDQHYEMEVDRFGHFSMDDVPMMVAYDENANEEDTQNLPTSFDIYVTDIAGNTYIRHYDIPKPGDPFEVSAVVNPLGKIFYSADKDQSDAYVATPVKAEDLEDGTLELPLLFGMSYEVGKLTLTKTENGFTVASEVVPNEEIDEDDYEITEEKLYVYTSKPTMQELRSHAGREYGYGEEIPLNDDETVWIVDEKEMTILEEDIMELELYDYEHSEDYPNYQEQ